MESSAFPYITAATAVVLGVLQMLLMIYAAQGRGRFRTGLGDGGNAKLLMRIRIHGNLAENAPLFLILLLLTEWSGKWSALVPLFALLFVAARLSHALGLRISSGPSPFRFFGVIATLVAVLGLCALLAITLVNDTRWLPLRLF